VVECLRLDPGDSVRHAALRLHALSETSPIDAAFECRTAGGRLVYPKVVEPAEVSDAR